MNDDDFDDGYDDFFDEELSGAEIVHETNALKLYADTLSYKGIDGITSDGDEYELRDLMTRARDMIAGGKISEDAAHFAKSNTEQGQKHRTAALSAYKTMQHHLQAVAYEDGKPVFELESAELWVSCIHAIVVTYGSTQSGLTALAARTTVDNLIYHLPDATPDDFKGFTFRTSERTILRWLEEAGYIYYALTHPAAGDA